MKNCPSCGRPIKFEEKYARIMSCGYCNSILEFGEGELSKIGEQSEFIEFPSIFDVGKTVKWKEKEIYVKGQLRYEYDGGFFDVFFVTIAGQEYYLKADDGQTILFQSGKWQNSDIRLLDKAVGETISLGGNNVFVQESGLFKLISMKGFVSSNLIPGKEYEYLDGIVDGKMLYFEKEIGVDKVRINKEIKIGKK